MTTNQRRQFNRGVPVWRPSWWCIGIGALSWAVILAAIMLALRIARN